MNYEDIHRQAWQHAVDSDASGQEFFRVLVHKAIDLAREDERKLRAFAQQVLIDWETAEDIDGADLRQVAVEHGLLMWIEGAGEYMTTKLLRGEE